MNFSNSIIKAQETPIHYTINTILNTMYCYFLSTTMYKNQVFGMRALIPLTGR